MKVRSDTRPLYQQVEEALLELLAGYAPGQQLPPEPALAASLGISRATLREALRHLQERRILTRRQGVGTFYSGPRVLIDSGLETLISVDTLALRQGLECSTEGLEIAAEPARAEFATPLGLPVGAPVTVVRRAKVTAGQPVAYMIDVLPQGVATVEQVCLDFQGSVLDLLLARRDPMPTHAATNLVPLKTSRELSERLHVPRSTVLLLMEETVYGRDNVPLDYSRNYFVPQYFQFHLVRRIPT